MIVQIDNRNLGIILRLRVFMFVMCFFFFFKQKTAYEMRISDWSSDVCSSDLLATFRDRHADVDLRISARQSLVGRARGENDQGSHLLDGGDIAIRFGNGDYPGYVTHKLFTSYSLPMCSPRLQIGRAHVCTPVTNAHLVCRLLLEKKNNH